MSRLIGSPTLSGLLVRRAGRRHMLDDPELYRWDRVALSAPGGLSQGCIPDLGGNAKRSFSFASQRALAVAARAQRRWFWQAFESRPFEISNSRKYGMEWFFAFYGMAVSVGALLAQAWFVTRSLQSPKLPSLPLEVHVAMLLMAVAWTGGAAGVFGLALFHLRFCTQGLRVVSVSQTHATVRTRRGQPFELAWPDLTGASRSMRPFRLQFRGGEQLRILGPSDAVGAVIRAARWRYLPPTPPRSAQELRRSDVKIAMVTASFACLLWWIAEGLPAPERWMNAPITSWMVVGLIVVSGVGFMLARRIRLPPMSRYGFVRRTRAGKRWKALDFADVIA